MKHCFCLFLFLISFSVYSSDTIQLGTKLQKADSFLFQSSFKNALALYDELSSEEVKTEYFEIYIKAQLGLAETYHDMGLYNLSLATLDSLIKVLMYSEGYDFYRAKAHQLKADNYESLFELDNYLEHVELFITHYRASSKYRSIYEAVYQSYLSRYHNLVYSIDKAYEHSSKSLEIYHQKKADKQLIKVYKLYENHCLTLRNKEGSREKYFDTLSFEVNKALPINNIKKAKALIAVSTNNLDVVFNYYDHGSEDFTPYEIELRQDSIFKNYDKAISIYNKHLGDKAEQFPRIYLMKSWIHYGKKEYDTALHFVHKALNSYSQPIIPQTSIYSSTQMVLNILRYKTFITNKKIDEGLLDLNSPEYLETLEIFENVWLKRFLSKINDNKNFVTSMYNQSPNKYLFDYYAQKYLSSEDENALQKALEYEDKSKYSSLSNYLTLDDYDKQLFKKPALYQEEVKLLLEKRLLAKFLGEVDHALTDQIINDKIKALEEDYDKIYKKLNTNKINFKEQQKALKTNQAQIRYIFLNFGNSKLYKVLLTNNKTVIKRTDFTTIFLNDTQFYLNKALADSDIAEFQNLSYSLYQKLFAQLEEDLDPGINEIEIVPFGQLSNLPFDLLVKSKKETNDFRKLDYLVKDYSFSYTLSNSLKTINSNEKHTHENALSIYKPKIPTEELSKLTLAENLANRIAERYDSKLFLNSNSTIENFKKSLMESKTVSVLSHGMSSNYISDKDKGIYLSDGLLSMDSIYALEANTDFLILNACDTANGFQDADQGNLNLVRAFKSIGVKSILSANWQIDEYSSTSILESFFENLEQHKPKSVALSEAKLNFINSNSPRMANPIYWAGLNITGDNSPVELEQNDSLIQIIFYTLIFVFLLFFALVLKKRFQNRH